MSRKAKRVLRVVLFLACLVWGWMSPYKNQAEVWHVGWISFGALAAINVFWLALYLGERRT